MSMPYKSLEEEIVNRLSNQYLEALVPYRKMEPTMIFNKVWNRTVWKNKQSTCNLDVLFHIGDYSLNPAILNL